MSLEPRDIKVIKAVGDHKILSFEQIQDMFFPSYHTLWRRLDKELKPNKYISEPFYINVGLNGKKTALYRLEDEGKKMYKELSGGRKYHTPRWNYSYLPHLIETNWILIKLRHLIKDFTLEYRIGPVQMDAYIRLKSGIKIAMEVDVSEFETKKEILRQIDNYEKLYTTEKIPHMLIFLTNRDKKIEGWLQENKTTNLHIVLSKRTDQKINLLKNKLATI